VSTRVSMPLQCASARTGALGKSSFSAVNLLEPDVWVSIGLTRFAETSIQRVRGKEGQSLGVTDKILSSSIGGALATWNQPIEVIRVEVFVA
jgi:hypothetical protein